MSIDLSPDPEEATAHQSRQLPPLVHHSAQGSVIHSTQKQVLDINVNVRTLGNML